MPLDAREEIVRAVCTDKWDGTRLSPSLFVGENTSVSRLAITPLADHWDLFRQYLQKPPERWLELIAQINVGRLQKTGLAQKNPVALQSKQSRRIGIRPTPKSPKTLRAGLPIKSCQN